MIDVVRIGEGMLGALRFQRGAFDQRSLASPLYASLLDTAIDDAAGGGICAEVLMAAPPGLDPIADAVVLRFLGAVHRLVLEGRAPALAPWFPTAGGTRGLDGHDPGPTFLGVVADHRGELVHGLTQPVQTNEVGRCAALAVGFTDVLRTWELPLRLLEVGASAGLNLRWDRWRYEADGAWGDPDAALRFADDAYRAPMPEVGAPLGPGDAVVGRAGCDRSPIDPRTEDGRLLLRSFVWPDQADRHARLDEALTAATEVPAEVDEADAGDWVAAQLADARLGVATVVYHSIVWQYLPAASRRRIADALERAGRRATARTPLAWVRMEPGADATAGAELHVRGWPGGEDRFVAWSGYHGRPVWRS